MKVEEWLVLIAVIILAVLLGVSGVLIVEQILP